jgi:hypothetical protein
LTNFKNQRTKKKIPKIQTRGLGSNSLWGTTVALSCAADLRKPLPISSQEAFPTNTYYIRRKTFLIRCKDASGKQVMLHTHEMKQNGNAHGKQHPTMGRCLFMHEDISFWYTVTGQAHASVCQMFYSSFPFRIEPCHGEGFFPLYESMHSKCACSQVYHSCFVVEKMPTSVLGSFVVFSR